MKKIDARGLACPQPVILTKKELDNGNNVVTIVDNLIAKSNLLKLADKLNCKTSVKEANGEIEISFFKNNATIEEEVKSNKSKVIYVIGKNWLGEGSEELGKILIKGFIYTLSQMDIPPSKIVFLNSGVYLTCEGSESLEDLKKLEEKETEIVSCGTCLDYFNLKDKLKAGTPSNMYEIVDIISTGENTVII
jgi:selenium metabolism protein YedF